MQDEINDKIMKKLSNLEQHVVNLIVTIQNITECLRSTTDIQALIKALKGPIPLNEGAILRALKETQQLVAKQQEIIEKNSPLEFKFIAERISKIEKSIEKIQREGIRKNVQLEFTCDGYELVKKPIGYDSEGQIEEPNEALNNLLATLLERESQAIIHRIGLFGEKSKTYEEIGKIFGVHRERARQIYAKAIRKCRHPGRKQYFDKIDNENLENEISGKRE